MARGRVVEARSDLLVILPGLVGEETYEVRPHDAQPGDMVEIYDDGSVDILERALPGPREIAVPMTPPE